MMIGATSVGDCSERNKGHCVDRLKMVAVSARHKKNVITNVFVDGGETYIYVSGNDELRQGDYALWLKKGNWLVRRDETISIFSPDEFAALIASKKAIAAAKGDKRRQ